jgi:hypothetical protein
VVDERLPDNAFDGGAPGRLASSRLLTLDGLDDSMSWLHWNSTSHRFYGMPLPAHLGRRQYVLEASDRTGSTARGEFTADVVSRRRVSRPTFESTAVFDVDFEQFSESDDLRMDVARRLAGAFGDRDTHYLAITRLEPGSVRMGWTNTSLTDDTGQCPVNKLTAIQSTMFDERGQIRESFRRSLEPYRLLSAEMKPDGSCIGSLPDNQPGKAGSGEPGVQPKSAGTVGDPKLVIIVLIVLAVVILILVIVCCVVCRPRRKNTKSWSPDKKIKPGAPIILAYELDDMAASTGGQPGPTKPLIGSGVERPPAPPNYQLATGPSLATDNSDQMSPLKYQPPPGSATSAAARHR